MAEDIDKYLRESLAGPAAVTVAVVRGDDVVYAKGFGLTDRVQHVAAGVGTVYDIGSVSKQFTAAAVMSLVDAGAVTVDDRIADHLDAPWSQEAADITLHHLLTHTSGLGDLGIGDYEPLTMADMIAGAARARLHSRPGTAHRYANLNYSLLAAVVVTVGGLGFEEYLAETLFAAAGMAETGWLLPTWDRLRVAQQYDASGRPQGRPNELPWAADGPHWALRGNGGLLSTAPDMIAWHRALRAGTVLSAESGRAMFTPHVPEDPHGEGHYGYGWAIWTDDGGRVAGHDGANDWSYCSVIRGLDTDDMVFVATSTGGPAFADRDLATELRARLR
ncbi:serine hydrolase domain-containing protein [Georgenia alba]|uniref:Serine hydrolase domain-containing protein n=1 Tax=Georgenia alba TaxID=2233858 RepID=A0ABW2QB08_9MICO